MSRLGLISCRVQPGFQFCLALREWESAGIQLRPVGNPAYVASLPLLWQSPSKWFSGECVWLVFRRSWVRIPAGFQIFFSCGFISHSLSIIIVHESLLSITLNNINCLGCLTLDTYAAFLQHVTNHCTDSDSNGLESDLNSLESDSKLSRQWFELSREWFELYRQ